MSFGRAGAPVGDDPALGPPPPCLTDAPRRPQSAPSVMKAMPLEAATRPSPIINQYWANPQVHPWAPQRHPVWLSRRKPASATTSPTDRRGHPMIANWDCPFRGWSLIPAEPAARTSPPRSRTRSPRSPMVLSGLLAKPKKARSSAMPTASRASPPTLRKDPALIGAEKEAPIV